MFLEHMFSWLWLCLFQPIAKVQWKLVETRAVEIAENDLYYHRYQISFVLAHIQTSCVAISYNLSNPICKYAHISYMRTVADGNIFNMIFSL